MGRSVQCRWFSDIPVPEVSALALRQAGGREWLIAVGDRSARVAQLDLGAGPGHAWGVADLADLAGFPAGLGRGAQVEAIAAAGTDELVVLWEHPNQVVVIRGGSVAGSVDLEVDAQGGAGWLARSWADPQGSHGEGLVLLRAGHLLVAKEKKPAALIEFGPAGQAPLGIGTDSWLPAGHPWELGPGVLQALAAWGPPPRRLRDLSEAALTPQGELLLLSDKDQAIHLVEPAGPAVGQFTITGTWGLSGVRGKPEGLAVRQDGTLLVATDTATGAGNLFTVAPGWR